MSRVRFPSLALLIAQVSCADLPPIEPGQCGNGVVDPGEQCDTFATAGQGTVCGEPDDGELACQVKVRLVSLSRRGDASATRSPSPSPLP